jgi:acetyl esterase/lipase
MNRRMGLWMVGWVVLVLAGRVWAADPPPDVLFERDVVYGKVGDYELKLNMSRPKEAKGAAPCIVIIHGGGWAAGDRSGHDSMTWMFAKKGYVSVTVGYRFAPKYLFPAQVQDVKCAVRFLRANAEKFGIDPNRIGAMGFSAGGHLSLMLGMMDKEDGLDDSGGSPGFSSKVQAVVSYFGPTDFTVMYPQASEKIVNTFIGDRATNAEAYKKASPISYVNKGDAPTLLFQGTKDILVDYTQAIRMVEKMTAAGVEGRAELIAGAGHGWGGKEMERTMAETAAFFEAKLGKK